MTKRKFYRSVLTVEVLSEEPLQGHLSLDTVHHLITDGDCSGKVDWTITNDEINGHVTALYLLLQGSEPGFFRLTNEGEDNEDEE